MFDFSPVFVHEKINCATWNNGTIAVTQNQRKYRGKHPIASPSRYSILKWVWNLQGRGTVKIQSRSRRLSATSGDQKTVSTYFYEHLRTGIRIAKRCQYFQNSSIQQIFRNGLHLASYKLHIVQEFEKREHGVRNVFATWCLQNIELNSSFLSRNSFPGSVSILEIKRSTNTR